MYNTDCRLVKSCFILYCSFLATGDSYNTLAARFQLGVSTVQKIVTRTCAVTWSELQPTLMPPPTKENWQRIESGFSTRWNFPKLCRCLGWQACSYDSTCKIRKFVSQLQRNLFYCADGFG